MSLINILTAQEAEKILGPAIDKYDEVSLGTLNGSFIYWKPRNVTITLDGNFTEDQLEAIAWWVRNKGKRS